MGSMVKIGVSKGFATIGFGESEIKWYSNGESSWEAVLLSNGKVRARLLFETMEQMLQVKKTLGNEFRVCPASARLK